MFSSIANLLVQKGACGFKPLTICTTKNTLDIISNPSYIPIWMHVLWGQFCRICLVGGHILLHWKVAILCGGEWCAWLPPNSRFCRDKHGIWAMNINCNNWGGQPRLGDGCRVELHGNSNGNIVSIGEPLEPCSSTLTKSKGERSQHAKNCVGGLNMPHASL